MALSFRQVHTYHRISRFRRTNVLSYEDSETVCPPCPTQCRPTDFLPVPVSTDLELIRVLLTQMVVLLDPGDNFDDVLRQKRSREKRFVFDVAFGPETTQVSYLDLF